MRPHLLFTSILLAVLAFTRTDAEASDELLYRLVSVQPAKGRPGFTQLPADKTGLFFTNVLAQSRQLTNQILLNGSGVAVGDVDGDGWCDLYFCGLDSRNALFRNRGQWRFEDITGPSGTAAEGLDATGAALADLDGDGDLDLLINSIRGGTLILFNDGKGRFERRPEVPILNLQRGGSSFGLADYDRDGDLDVYIANYRTTALSDMPNTRFWITVTNGQSVVSRVNGRPATDLEFRDRYWVNARGGIDEMGEADVLLRNEGGTRFVPVSFTDGTFLDEAGQPLKRAPLDWGLCAMFRDLNGDAAPDLYVCNDFSTEDRIWLNDRQGHFRAAQPLAFRKLSLFSMGVDVADINRDGHDDIFVLDMLSRDQLHRMTQLRDRNPPVPVIGLSTNRPQYMMNTLFLNHGDGTYSEAAHASGVAASDWSWTAIFLDVDLDGWEDLLISNGHDRAARDIDVAEQLRRMRTERTMSREEMLQARKLFPRLPSPNVAFRNERDGTFTDQSEAWGFGWTGVSQGMCLADLDNDGDMDVVLNNMNDPAGLFRNDSDAPRLAVRLKGLAPNTQGIGARVTVAGGPVLQSQVVIAGGRYASSDQPQRTFAAKTTAAVLTIEVAWPSGRRSFVPAAKPNCLYEIEEPAGAAGEAGSTAAGHARNDRTAEPKSASAPVTCALFENASESVEHVHRDEPFDNFAAQPLLPARLSELGPGVAWCDLDGDGWEELIVGSGRGGELGVFRNLKGEQFERVGRAPFQSPVTRDQTGVLGWRDGTQGGAVIAGSANYEDGLRLGGAARFFGWNRSAPLDLVPGQESSTGPLAMADIDVDGDLDLFVGGRCVPGQFPRAASSSIWRNDRGTFALDRENSKLLADVGLVSGAVWSDVDENGFPDLVLACPWGAVRLYTNGNGTLADRTSGSGLGAFQGWWNGVTAADFDGDGRLDLAASNWGRNTKYEQHRQRPLALWYGRFDSDSTLDLIEGYFDASRGEYVPVRDLDDLGKAIPSMGERFATHASYGRASIQDVLGESYPSAAIVQANLLESAVFLNRGGHFEVRALPFAAQLAPAFGISAADFDGDQRIDLFLAQNFFGVSGDTPRYDAGRGLVLRGNGRGEFSALSARESGVAIAGEQRGSAAGDYDRDGRVDLLVGQNGAPVQLYRNATGRTGVRVNADAGPGNPSGVGTQVRLGSGAVHEVQMGSGYWSQNSSILVIAPPPGPIEVRFRLPGEDWRHETVPQGTAEVRLSSRGLHVVHAAP